MQKFTLKRFYDYVVVLIVLASFLFLGYTIGRVIETNSKPLTPVIVLKLLYQFNDLEDIENNMLVMDKYLEPSAMDSIEFTDSRVINVYYKFKAKSSIVNVKEHYDGIIYYTLTNENIDSNEVFAFEYEMNEQGKLTYIKDYSVRRIGKG